MIYIRVFGVIGTGHRGKPPHPDFPNDVVTYPPSYPNLFDYSLFKRNPFPPPSGTYNLFWCSWLVVKAYHENGNQIQPNLYTPNMYVDFNNRGKLLRQPTLHQTILFPEA